MPRRIWQRNYNCISKESCGSILREVRRSLSPKANQCPDSDRPKNRVYGSFNITTPVNEFYKKRCQEKSFASTGGREDFVSRSSPLLCKRVPSMRSRGFALACLPFL